ncbi:MAG: hypothetical protein ISR00_00130 [Flavobacteriales bacterium]|nr:hypothetical protein [Flavobacteriales bacterium]MBL6872339.1 hypothetical protein [Flavobacteriales bacterium]
MKKLLFPLLFISLWTVAQPSKNQIIRLTSVNSPNNLTAITSPNEGSLVFVNSNKTIYLHNGTSWSPLGNPWKINGNQCESTDFLGTTNNQDFIFRTNNSERMVIKGDGKIGVNTNSPSAAFQVGESSQGSEDIITSFSQLSSNINMVTGNFFVDNDINTNSSISNGQWIQFNGNPSDPKIVTTYTLRFLSYAATGFHFQGRLNNNSAWVTLDNQSNVTWPGNNVLQQFNFNNTIAYEDYRISFTSWNNHFLYAIMSEIEFKENINILPLLTFEQNGRVGINIDPPTEKLQVGGNILANAYTPDYVFEYHFDGFSEQNPDYKPKSLKDTKEFIKKNKHLPGVPSAKEVKQIGGIIINQAIDKNLEKIEELYLHLFKVNERIKILEGLIDDEEQKKRF